MCGSLVVLLVVGDYRPQLHLFLFLESFLLFLADLLVLFFMVLDVVEAVGFLLLLYLLELLLPVGPLGLDKLLLVLFLLLLKDGHLGAILTEQLLYLLLFL